MPPKPKKCCGKNVKLTPKNIIKNCVFIKYLFIKIPEKKGNQKVKPAIIAKTAPIDNT